MTILGLDPGTDKSSLVGFDGKEIELHVEHSNEDMLDYLKNYLSPAGRILVIEQVESFGMAVGREVFRTVFWSGRFAECFGSGHDFAELPRRVVKQHLCHTARATDANIRQALIDRFGPTKDVAFGTKRNPGPLHGITSHKLAALAVAVTYWDQQQARANEIRPHVIADF